MDEARTKSEEAIQAVRSAPDEVLSGHFRAMWGAEGDHVLVIRRSDLLHLLDRVLAHPRIECYYGAEAISALPDGQVTYQTTGQRHTIGAEVVVGADGLNSVIRHTGRFGARTKIGTTYMRGLFTGPTITATVGEFWTPLGIFGIAPLPGATYVYSSTQNPMLRTAVEARDLAKFPDAWATTLPLARRTKA